MKEINNNIYHTYGDRWYEADDDPVALLRAESKTKCPWIVTKLKEHGLLNKETKILDVGCGAGFLSNELATYNLKVVGVDISEESLTIAKKYDQTKMVTYQVADANKLPFPDNYFDVVTAMDFLEHVEDPSSVIKEFSRVLKPRGLFFFHTFNRNLFAYLIVIKLVELLVKNTPKDMHILRLFIKPSELYQYCMRSQLKVMETVGIRPILSTIPLKNIFTGIVPKTMRFKITKSLILSYMGVAIKH